MGKGKEGRQRKHLNTVRKWRGLWKKKRAGSGMGKESTVDVRPER